MKEKEKQLAQLLVEAIATLPEEKKQYFIGFAEGVAAMAEQSRTSQDNQPKSA